MEDLKESFLKNWDRFVTELKGNLFSFSDKQFLSYASASQILADSLFEWKSEANVIGRWLDKLKINDREKYEKVSGILFKGIRFENIEVKSDNNEKLLPYIPYGISVAALGATFVFHSSIWLKVMAAVLPPVLLKSPIEKLQNDLKRQTAKKLIPEYLTQLDKYKTAILLVL